MKVYTKRFGTRGFSAALVLLLGLVLTLGLAACGDDDGTTVGLGQEGDLVGEPGEDTVSGADGAVEPDAEPDELQLHSLTLVARASAIGKRVSDLCLDELQVAVEYIQRGGERLLGAPDDYCRLPLEDVRDDIEAGLRAQEAQTIIFNRAEQLLVALNNGEDFGAAAEAAGADVSEPMLLGRQSPQVDQNVLGQVFTAKKPQQGAPTRGSVANSTGGITVFSLEAVLPGRPESIPLADRDAGKLELAQQAGEQIAAMSARLNEMEGEAEALRSRVNEERNQAMTDALTGIPNRLAYEQRLEQEVARWKRFGTPLVLVVWDIDHFKRVNDRFGHKAGDKVLRTIARVLADHVRETDFVARYGGEEFAMLMTGSALDACLHVAEKLRGAVEGTGFHFRDEAVTITASCGLAEMRDGDSTEQWFERADRALYRAKQEGRNRCELAS